jgi:hypothetical protein
LMMIALSLFIWWSSALVLRERALPRAVSDWDHAAYHPVSGERIYRLPIGISTIITAISILPLLGLLLGLWLAMPKAATENLAPDIRRQDDLSPGLRRQGKTELPPMQFATLQSQGLGAGACAICYSS